VWYSAPLSSADCCSGNDALDDDQQMLIDIEQNIANIERSFTQGRRGSWQSAEGDSTTTASASKPALKRGGSLITPDKSPAQERKRWERTITALFASYIFIFSLTTTNKVVDMLYRLYTHTHTICHGRTGYIRFKFVMLQHFSRERGDHSKSL
jgi:hypothetical protein